MKTKKLLFACLLIGCTATLFSKDINYSTAEKVALNFFFERMNTFVNATNYNDLNITDSKFIDNAYYVVNFEKGWVLVSANDVMVPIFGYNYTGSFPTKEQQSDNFKSWMQHYVDQVNYIKENNIESDENKTKWKKYLTDDLQLLLNNNKLEQVGPLLTCTWHQNFPYNIFCPEDPAGPGGYTFAGCGATVLTQIMHYWRYPVHGSGSNTYYCYPYGNQTANFAEATYEWDAMQNNIDYDNPWEIAEITYHVAVSINMNFGPGGSGSNINSTPNALSTYFNYDTSVVIYKNENFSQAVWEDMIREDLDLFRPVRYRGQTSKGAHAMVCDGYQDPNYFHFNFGWSGNGNGFYTLEDLNGFSEVQRIIKNIFPADPDYPYIAEGLDTLTFLSGSFTDGSGPAEDYPSGIETSWLIDPQSETDSISDITLTFIQFNTATTDYLRVYDGETTNDVLLGEFSGDDLPGDITSSGNKMLITFSSTGIGTGFLIEYNTTTPSYCEPQQYYTEPTGTISDGSGSFYYNNSTICMYIIEHPTGVKYNLEFSSFSTEVDNDVVTIYDGDQNVIGEFSGSDLPEFMEIETDKIYVIWNTNEIFKDEGWSFDYTVDVVGIKEDIIENNLCIIPNPFSNQTTIEFTLPDAGIVSLKICDITGKKIKILSSGYHHAGEHRITWDAEGFKDGLYFLRLETNGISETRKLLLIK
jgi:uncharacterized protein (UPF0305 family)